MTTFGPTSEELAPHILLQGELICTNDSEANIVRAALPQHIDLTRAEPECICFEVTPKGIADTKQNVLVLQQLGLFNT